VRDFLGGFFSPRKADRVTALNGLIAKGDFHLWRRILSALAKIFLASPIVRVVRGEAADGAIFGAIRARAGRQPAPPGD
jgi:hypothetical protein